jgi:hypothetical protein
MFIEERKVRFLVRQCGVFFALWQNMSHVFARDFGKKRCANLGAGGHSAGYTIPHPLIFGKAF